ncbi:helix-turn-helix transcriptional regulator [Dyadobacter subterraneus]|uniref:Helix-turn-helix transcriptional regulator n=1 Tax=Dyadobacter subterraneus TaxID=2773304 RepID=A0ABR9WAB8_9BACT|nr:helix-turn-helix transcriptional regulator [Dyadobacter subterraneus]MBE9462427.1 helix-turn-helix transcriptional regulator [Dyadobacter subterraneus]
MSIVSNNIKYLRRLNGLTQEQFARKIAIKRSLLGAYEEARANPNLTNLKNMAAAFGITVDNLLKNDLRRIRETPDLSLPLNGTRPMTVSHSGSSVTPPRMPTYAEPQPLSKIMDNYQQPEPSIRTVARQVTLKPVNGNAYQPPVSQQSYTPAPTPQPNLIDPRMPVFNNQYAINSEPATNYREDRSANYPTIQWVGKNQWIEYIANYQNPAFLTHLPSFQLPNLPSGYYRAFESSNDFEYPGSLLVGSFIRNWYEIKDGSNYLFVLKNQGFLYRKAFNQVKTKGTLLLSSDISGIPELEAALHEVLEVWEVKAFISLQLPNPSPSMDRIGQLVDELQIELSRAKPFGGLPY